MITQFTLSNGIRAVHDPRPGSGLFNVAISIGSGSEDDPAHQSGLTDLAIDCMKAGTNDLTRAQTMQVFQNMGSFISCAAGHEDSVITMGGLAENKDDTLAFLSHLIRNPAMRDADIAQQKMLILSHIKEQEQDLDDVNGNAFMRTAYAGQTFGLSTLGTAETIGNLNADDIRARYKSLFSDMDNIVISLAGDLTLDEAKALTEKGFGDMKPMGQAVSPASPPVFTPGDSRLAKPSDKLLISMAFDAPPASSAQRFISTLLAKTLSGGMSSPLFKEIREKRSLVYSVGADYAPRSHSGMFMIGASTEADKAAELIEETIKLLGRVAREGFTDAELESARNSEIRRQTSLREESDKAAKSHAINTLLRGFPSNLDKYKAGLDQVTNDDIRRACADMLTEGKFVLSATGPVQNIPDRNAILSLMKAQVDPALVPPARNIQETYAKSDFASALSATAVKPESDGLQKTVLANGLTVMTVERPGLLSCGMWVGVGAKDESKAQNGASHMIEHMMFKGTPSFGPGEIMSIIQKDMGAGLNAYTSKDMTAYYFYNLLPEHLPKVTQICGEMVFAANIDETEYAGGPKVAPDGSSYRMRGEREVVFKEINDSIADPGDVLMEKLMGTVFAGQAMGRPILGTKRSLMRNSAADLRAYRDQFYSPNNTTFVCVGPVKHEDAVATVEKLFGALPTSQITRNPPPVFKTGKAVKSMEISNLTTAMIAFKGPDPAAGRNDAAKLTGWLLGGSENSPLFKKLKLELDVVDSVGMGYNGGSYNFWSLQLSGDAADIRKAVEIACQEIAALPASLPAERLEAVKMMSKLSSVNAAEINRDLCRQIGSQYTEKGKVTPMAETIDKINAITLDQIAAEARAILKTPVAVSYVTPPGTDPALLPGVQEINTMRRKALRDLEARLAPVSKSAAPEPANGNTPMAPPAPAAEPGF